ncbi:MAG: sulfatase-like hydrolase/transferase [Candidatus Hydrogenedentes bacterium]|nr:sulfatase-like hydrolase/transferase [Candidatus Hydrogenedentota bacterium]
MPNKNLSRREVLRALTGAAAAAGASCATTGGRASRRPNFVVVFSDDHTYRAVGYNNPSVKTPNMDRIARGGAIIDQCYVASPICVASRASIMSGLFPQQHGAVGLDATGFQKCVVEEKRYKTFAQVLADSGYATAFCGKSHLGDPKAYGFTEGKENNDVYDVESFDFAKEFLASRTGRDEPYLLWVAPHQPHVPLLPAQEWLDLYDVNNLHVDPNFRESPPAESIYNQGVPGERYYRDTAFTKNYKSLSSGPPRTKEQVRDFMHAYYATISHLDEQIGELFDFVQKSDESWRTTFIYLADNGYHLGNHGLGNKITMHEESVRVPMFAHGYGVRRPGTRIRSLVSSLDIYPTLLDFAGINLPEHLMGASLRQALKYPERSNCRYVASECVGVGGKAGQGHRMVRSGDLKYVMTDSNEEALFDEATDPYELSNIVADPRYASDLSTLCEHMRTWMERVGDTHAPPPRQRAGF